MPLGLPALSDASSYSWQRSPVAQVVLLPGAPVCLQAVTLPACWYTSPAALQLEKHAVLYNTWQVLYCMTEIGSFSLFVADISGCSRARQA